MLMRTDYDKLIKKYFVDEKIYMFTKLVFSKGGFTFSTFALKVEVKLIM